MYIAVIAKISTIESAASLAALADSVLSSILLGVKPNRIFFDDVAHGVNLENFYHTKIFLQTKHFKFTTNKYTTAIEISQALNGMLNRCI